MYPLAVLVVAWGERLEPLPPPRHRWRLLTPVLPPLDEDGPTLVPAPADEPASGRRRVSVSYFPSEEKQLEVIDMD